MKMLSGESAILNFPPFWIFKTFVDFQSAKSFYLISGKFDQILLEIAVNNNKIYVYMIIIKKKALRKCKTTISFAKNKLYSYRSLRPVIFFWKITVFFLTVDDDDFLLWYSGNQKTLE